MKKIIDLKDLLKHEILDLYSAEEQIIEGLPGMIENANKPELKDALTRHLEVSKTHKDRLDKMKDSLKLEDDQEDSGFFSNLFGGHNSVTSAGVAGLIKEAEKMMAEDEFINDDDIPVYELYDRPLASRHSLSHLFSPLSPISSQPSSLVNSFSTSRISIDIDKLFEFIDLIV